MRLFRVAFTGDFLDDSGRVAYGDIGLAALDSQSHVSHRFLNDLAPRQDDPGYWARLYSLEVKPEHIEGVDGLVVLRPWVKRSTFARGAGDLVVIGRSGAGYDKIDLAACTEHGVAVFNAPMALNHPTASTALLFMLALAKRLPEQERITRQGRWDLQASVMGSEIRGRTLGIVGLGHTGSELARLVAPFAMRVLAYSPHADAEQARRLGVRLTSLDDVMTQCDFLSLHCRLTASTRGLIGREQLALLKPGAYFINVGRGELVDQRALTEALRDRRIAGAALDVFAVEPLPSGDPLLALDNVILTPHWSASTSDVWLATGAAMAQGMLRTAHGEVPENVVNAEVLEQPLFREKLARFQRQFQPMRFLPLSCLFWPSIAVAALAAGCARRQPQVAPPDPVAIPVSRPVTREITDAVEFTGRTEAIQSVDIRPRTTGYLVKIPFKEGSEVKAGDLLFVIDQRPYQAQLDQAAGQVDLYQAQLKLAKVTLARDLAINNITPNAISRQQLDQDRAAVEQADAQVKAFEKNMEVYKLNQEFTKVVSPISGMVSRYYLTVGNLVNQDQTLLTTVVSLDPIYAYFDVDEPTLLRVRKAINEGKIKPRESSTKLPVFMGLQGEEGFPHEGEVDFVNNQLNPTTGSILVRGVFPNPKPPGGTRLLSPGMFVRIRLPIGQPHPALLVIDRAVQSDQGMKYVYVIDLKGMVQYRRVTTGSLQEDGLRVITEGLKPDERVVVAGLQQVHPHDRISPELVPMPSLNQPSEEVATSGGKDSGAVEAAPAKSKAGP